MLSKIELRDVYKNKRLSVTDDVRFSDSERVRTFLSEFIKTLSITTIACYFPFSQEIDPLPFVKKWLLLGKSVVFPRFNLQTHSYDMVRVSNVETDFILGLHNIMEPESRLPVVDLQEIDMWLVPGIVFDQRGNRIGFGQGVYDRLLSGVSATKVALAYDWQVVPSIPSDSRDVKMDVVITNETTYMINQTPTIAS